MTETIVLGGGCFWSLEVSARYVAGTVVGDWCE